ncbi:MAG: hypothetical protein IPG53_10515 [Ignavibacteriales bacterium]|nr:hypothetical protein [Ignavibacteriales bacterium]
MRDSQKNNFHHDSPLKKEKEIEKNVRKKLHQIYGAYQNSNINYKLLSISGGESGVDEVLKSHVSTAERMGFYEEFYRKIFDVFGEPGRSIKFMMQRVG